MFIKNYPEIKEKILTRKKPGFFSRVFDKKNDKIRAGFIEQTIAPGFVLEVECKDANVLGLLKKNGFKVLGIDSDVENVENSKIGVDEIFNYDFETFFHYENEFDAVLFFNVLGFVDNPDYYLEKANKLVKRGGFIIIEEKLFNTKLDNFFKKYYSGFDNGKRKYFFNTRVLKKIMRFYGFRMKNIRKSYVTGYLDFIKSFSRFLGEKLKLKNIFLKIPFLLPVFLLSPLINLYFFTSNYIKQKAFGTRCLIAFTHSK